jgi:hypothetical protein
MKFILPKLSKPRKSIDKKISQIDKKLTKNKIRIAELIDDNNNSIELQKSIINKANETIKHLEVQLQQIQNLNSK